MFTIAHKDGNARTGIIKTAHGEIRTPAFIPVATKATIKALTMQQFREIGFESLLCNTYHLYLQPGAETVQKLGGLHSFMGFGGPIWTDSGGFQVFSLNEGTGEEVHKEKDEMGGVNKKRPWKISDEKVEFLSHIDASRHELSPESSIRIQEQLGADIIFAFDQCIHFDDDYENTRKAMERTHRWAERCVKEWKGSGARTGTKSALFGIVQGGRFKELREASAKYIASLDFPGFGIGGIFGDPSKEIHGIVKHTLQFLPEGKPKHMLGIGSVEDIFDYVGMGADTFDCVLPTRLGRVGYIFIRPESGGNTENKFRYRITNAQFKQDNGPLDGHCACYVCKNFSRAYLYHLFKAEELLAYTLATYHNLWFFQKLMEEIRESIGKGEFGRLKREWVQN